MNHVSEVQLGRHCAAKRIRSGRGNESPSIRVSAIRRGPSAGDSWLRPLRPDRQQCRRLRALCANGRPWGTRSLVHYVCAVLLLLTTTARADDTSTLLTNYCIDCHGAPDEDPEAGFSLSAAINSAPLHTSGPAWKKALDAIEGHDMPPSDADLPSSKERRQLIDGIRKVLAQPSLETETGQAVRDPGRPVLRRMTRLEYNNTVRDLLGLDTDVLMFSERLPFGREHYQPAAGKVPDRLRMGAREYGAKYPVLLRDASLPGDSRAEYGFANRGDAQNLSAVRLAQYVKLAGEIAFHPELLSRARRMEELFPGARYKQPSGNTSMKSKPLATSGAGLATNNNVARSADASHRTLDEFREQLDVAFAEDRGGVFSGEELRNSTIAGKGGLIRIAYGRSAIRALAVNPNEDIWIAAFGTAEESSGDTLLTNHKKKQRSYEFTFQGAGTGRFAGLAEVGIVLLSRKGQQGTVRLKATFDDNSTAEIPITLKPGAGTDNTFVSFVAEGDRTIRRLLVDGTDYSGDYVLVDDLSFITRDAPNRKPLVQAEEPDEVIEPEDVKPDVEMDRSIAKRSPAERLKHFLRRAFRRDVTDSEVDIYLALYQAEIDRGGKDETAMRSAIQGVLSSPSFLYVVVEPHTRDRTMPAQRPRNRSGRGYESPAPDVRATSPSSGEQETNDQQPSKPSGRARIQDGGLVASSTTKQPGLVASSTTKQPGLVASSGTKQPGLVASSGTVARVSNHSLASRLSYFLWSTMPDDELLDLAENGTLQNEDVLAAQVQRMLRDRRSVELTENFYVQWLRLAELWSAQPDNKLFPDFYSAINNKRTLARDMFGESLLQFQTILIEDRPITELLDCEYTFVNSKLIDFYDHPLDGLRTWRDAETIHPAEAKDDQLWHRVKTFDESRGGVVTSPAVLTLTSFPHRTSSIRRGVWILDTLFNRHPPAPQVAVADIDEQENVEGLTLREKVELHRAKPACAACHDRIDPPGFALENFDAIGRWREKDGDEVIDASGELAGIGDFATPAEFKARLMSSQERFVRGFTEHLLSFALGRKLEYYDTPAVEKIVQATIEDDCRLSTLLVEIVKSYPFRNVRTP